MAGKKKVLAIPADIWACGTYRVIEPFAKMAQLNSDISFEVYDFQNNNTPTVKEFALHLSTYDAVVFQRVSDPRFLAIMHALKKKGVKVYMDIDDDLLNVASTSPASTVWHKNSKATKVFLEALKICDMVFVSTPQLIATYCKYVEGGFAVFRNAIDTSNEKFSATNSRRGELDTDCVNVMWSGSSTHLDSMEVIAGGLRSVFDSRPNARLVLCGNKEYLDMFNINSEQKTYIEPVGVKEYFNIPSYADIGLAPVKLNDFNDAKSELKCLEFGVWGVPTVCSPAAPYTRFNEISGGANLLAKKNRIQQWINHISELIDNPQLRMEMGQKSRDTILKHYSLDSVNKSRYEFFAEELLKT